MTRRLVTERTLVKLIHGGDGDREERTTAAWASTMPYHAFDGTAGPSMPTMPPAQESRHEHGASQATVRENGQKTLQEVRAARRIAEYKSSPPNQCPLVRGRQHTRQHRGHRASSPGNIFISHLPRLNTGS